MSNTKTTNTVTQEQINHLLDTAQYEAAIAFDKCVVVMAKLENGFVITESSACVDPENFDLELGVSICRERIANKLWELEGYALQKALYEKAKKPARKPAAKKTTKKAKED